MAVDALGRPAKHAGLAVTSPGSRVAAADRRRLKILFFTWNYFPAPAGGAERQARLQAEELVRRGHSVTVVCPRAKGFGNGEIGGVEIRRLFCAQRQPFARITYLLSLLAFGARHVRKYDLVHVHLANLQADLIVPLCRLLRRPSYVKVACGGSAGEVNRLAGVAHVTRWVGLRWATTVQALSSEIAAELKSIGVSNERIVQIPNGLDHLAFRPPTDHERREARDRLGLGSDQLMVLFVGRFARYKGVLDLLAVWASRQPANALLVLVGSAAADQPIGELGAVPNMLVREWTDEVVNYLRASDVFVYPSYADGMSNALLEAMACGCAVIASRSGAASDMIDDGVSGVLFDAGDRDALGDCLLAVAGDPARRAALSEAASGAAARYAIGDVVDQIESEYRTLTRPR